MSRPRTLHSRPSSKMMSASTKRGPLSDSTRSSPSSHDPRDNSQFAYKRYLCGWCRVYFERPSALRQHMLTHTREKPHPCYLCGRHFSVSSNLRRHYKSCKIYQARARLVGSEPLPTAKTFDIRIPASTATTAKFIDGFWAPQPPHMLNHAHPIAISVLHSQVNSVPLASPAQPFGPPLPYKYCIFPSLEEFHNTAYLTPHIGEALQHPLPHVNITMPLPPARPSVTMPSYWSDAGSSPISPISPSSAPSRRFVLGGDDQEYDERDSYANGVPECPYHPATWTGILPGPALLKVDQLVLRAVKDAGGSDVEARHAVRELI